MIFLHCVGALILITAIVIYKLNRLEGRSKTQAIESATLVAIMFILIVLIKSCHG